MSKGPGHVERANLGAMQPLGEGDKAFTIPELCEVVYAERYAKLRKDHATYGPDHSEKVAVRRAVWNVCRRYRQLVYRRQPAGS